MPRHATKTSFKPGPRPNKPVRERLMAHIQITPEGCWLWTGCLRPNGYGMIGIAGRARGAHIVSYELEYGPVPEGLELDHKCHSKDNCAGGIACLHRRCINPDHLEPVTRKENVRRGYGNQRVVENRKAQTHCLKGHEYTPKNTYVYRGYRMCRKCHCETEKRRQQRLKA
jgi:hypothetical protein